MPWRKTKDSYAIVVSEYMLQQTTVATVRPYYDRFLKKFPTIASLAHGDLNDVLALWSGLGYYARARNLWAAMKTVHTTFKGKIPSDPDKLLKLPGVGSYTSGAIASLAFNKPAIVLDGNIIRVMMRLLALEEDPRLKAVQVVLRKLVFDLAQIVSKNKKLVSGPRNGPRHLVLALMDLGATVCLPQSPKCGQCPAAELCLAKQFSKQEEIPAKGDQIDRPAIRRLYAVLKHENKWLVAQRPKEGLFGGLWEFIGVDASPGIEPVSLLEEAVLRETGLYVRVQQAIPAFEHQLTHRVFTVRSFICEPLKGRSASVRKKGTFYERFKWIGPADLEKMGVSAITKRISTQIVV